MLPARPPSFPPPVVLPRPVDQGPIPIVPPGPSPPVNITEAEVKRQVWLAFNQGYNDGFVRGFHSAMQRRGVPPPRPPRGVTTGGQRYRLRENVHKKN